MPRLVDHDQRRRELAAAAAAVIARAGLSGATMREVAEEAGCTTGMVTHYFDDKQQVLLAALDAVTRAVAARIRAHVRTARGPLLPAVLAESLPLDEVRRIEWGVWIAFWGAAAVDEALRVAHVERYRRWRNTLADLLERDGRDPAAAESLMLAVDGIGLHATFDPAAWPAERQLAELERRIGP
ncbi:TetR/AcrR family transcriptional regulator [Pseudonocardia sp. CA-107938]|uniref:TetR/AcrR family transcriptional regulator n=1 Tax=Pseudonocardia sp. CA-107938 TaxID=3240021 RepID=UPI003D8E9ADA